MDDHGLRVYDSILGMLSGADNPTPLVRLNRVTPFRHTQVYGKLEWYNPFGAVKDRVAANLIEDGEARRTVQGQAEAGGADVGQHRHGAGDDRECQGLLAHDAAVDRDSAGEADHAAVLRGRRD